MFMMSRRVEMTVSRRGLLLLDEAFGVVPQTLRAVREPEM